MGNAESTSGAQKDKVIKRRENIAKEILSTEEAYVNSLRAVNELYLIPITDSKDSPFSPQEIDVIFSNWRDILVFHETIFLPAIRSRASNWNETQLIGDVFVKNANELQQYSKYVNNFDDSLAMIAKCSKRKSVQKFFETTKAKPGHTQLNLGAYLIMPVQRIPRYILLLSDLYKYTPSRHVDFASLGKALKEIEKMANLINEQKREEEDFKKLTVFAKTVDWKEQDPLLQRGRRLIREADMVLVKIEVCDPIRSGYVHKQGVHLKDWRKRFFVLENNRLSYFEENGDEQPKGVFELRDIVEVRQASQGNPAQFAIAVRDGPVYECRCGSKEEADGWVADLLKTMKKSTSNKSSNSSVRASKISVTSSSSIDSADTSNEEHKETKKKNQEYHFILLNDLLLITKKKLGTQWKCSHVVKLATSRKCEAQTLTDSDFCLSLDYRTFYIKGDPDEIAAFSSALVRAIDETRSKLVKQRLDKSMSSSGCAIM